MMGLTLGCCYILIASHKPMHRRTLIANIPLRILATLAFWGDGPKGRNVALYEATWAILNAAALPFA
jgi:hypothetical protein